MLLKQKIGISSYGACLPQTALATSEIEQAQGKVVGSVQKALGVLQKTIPSIDEDSVTLATQASWQALQRWPEDKRTLGAIFMGSESHPYAVKPSGTVIKAALGLSDNLSSADLQFACKAGTAGLQIILAFLAGDLIKAGLAIGADTAQAERGDALEFTAAAGAASFILSRKNLLAKVLATTSVMTDTPDFWRRPQQSHPQHAGRFTGEPAYFYHVELATKNILAETKLNPEDFAYCIFHTPNAKFPQAVAKKLGFTQEQLEPSLIVKKIGNTYAAAVPLALAAVLDVARAGEKILVTSYGSGAGADSFVLETTSLLEKQRASYQQLVSEQISTLKLIKYGEVCHPSGSWDPEYK